LASSAGKILSVQSGAEKMVFLTQITNEKQSTAGALISIFHQ
jgi:hypothetical protein